MPTSDPYHVGERQVQALSGQIRQAEASRKVIAKRITPGAWKFLAAQSMLLLGSWDGERGAWPSLLFGSPGFATTHDGTSVRLSTANTYSDDTDPLWRNLQRNGLIGMLAIEPATRRRLRINGHLSSIADASPADGSIEIIVDQSYPNCPKYIRRRILKIAEIQSERADISENSELDGNQLQLIANADTFFVASVHQKLGADISHKGGNSGFVGIESATRLRIPDYAGNGMFNTLGNIHASGFAGLLFIDFENSRQIQIIGDAQIDWTRTSAAEERSWLMDIHHVRRSTLPVDPAWEFAD
jgi:uncharacterized protein